MANQNSNITKEILNLLPQIKSLLVDGYSVNEITNYFIKYSYSAIYNCIQKNGLSSYVSTKNIGKSRASKKRYEDYDKNHKLTKEILQKLYHEEKKDLYEIAELYNMSPSGVLWRMNKLGIKTRNISEANYLIYEKKPELKEVHRINANLGKIGVFAKGNYTNTWIEMAFKDFCEKNSINYTRSFQITKTTHRYDFLIENKIIVELDGVYWHNNPKQKEKDRLQEEFARQKGYFVLRFTDEEIKKSKGECFEIVREYV